MKNHEKTSSNSSGKSKRRAILLIILLVSMAGNYAIAQDQNKATQSAITGSVPASIYDFKVPALNGGVIDFSQFRGKKILIVNTTSIDGNNAEYARLDALQKKYQDKLVVIGFPGDDFRMHFAGDIRPRPKEVESFKKANYNVSFPMAAKVGLKGKNRAPIYVWLTEKKYNHMADSEVRWDFQKYLINEKGDLVSEFEPKVKANDSKIAASVEN